MEDALHSSIDLGEDASGVAAPSPNATLTEVTYENEEFHSGSLDDTVELKDKEGVGKSNNTAKAVSGDEASEEPLMSSRPKRTTYPIERLEVGYESFLLLAVLFINLARPLG